MDIVVDSSSRTHFSIRDTYTQAIAAAGGTPVPLVPAVSLLDVYLDLCDGFILTGGRDAIMQAFGQQPHPKAEPIHPARQEFELALLQRLDTSAATPVLGICFGFQLMALHAGGSLDQHLPDHFPDAAKHQDDRRHQLRFAQGEPSVLAGLDRPPFASLDTLKVVSSHHQGITHAGRLRPVAFAPHSDLIEAIDDPRRPYYLGVQWHPERGDNDPLSLGLIRRFVDACRQRKTE